MNSGWSAAEKDCASLGPNPTHAQRIVAITGDGDEGLSALQVCQAYVREIVQ